MKRFLCLGLYLAAAAVHAAPGFAIEPYTVRQYLDEWGTNPETGRVVQVWSLSDSGGYHYMVLSVKTSGKGADRTVTLYGEGQLQDHGGLLREWSFREPGGEVEPRFDLQRSGVADRDRNGQAEYYIVYDLVSGKTVTQRKVLVFSGDVKHKVTAFPASAELTCSANWLELAPAVRTHALSLTGLAGKAAGGGC